MTSLKDLETWRRELGLLPVPLFGEDQERRSYVLLNGARGNFCLDLDERRPDEESRNEAWSSNVGHYVTLYGDDVFVQRWDRPRPEEIRYSEVTSDLERFHRYLEADAPESDSSVVAHALRIFRSLRAALGSAYEGHQALRAFLYLLAAATEDDRRRVLSGEQWQLDPEAEEIVRSIDENTWNSLFEDLTRGRAMEHLRPNFTLMLRHAAGVLFQEAHYAAVFDTSGQLSLHGFAPAPVAVRPETSAVGLHFTPTALARALVEEALVTLGELPAHMTVLDPACGSGEFLRESLRQLRLRGYGGSVRLIGFDISPAACDMARFGLAWEAQGAGDRVSWDIRPRDALGGDVQWPQSLDLVLMNPPFLSWRDMAPGCQEAVRRVLGEHARMLPDLAAAFLFRAAESLGPRAVLGSILPASFLDGAYARSIRVELGQRLDPRLIARLGSQGLFHEATVDPAFYVASTGLPATDPLALWADHRPSSNSAALRALRRARTIGGGTLFPVVRDGFSLYPNEEIGRGDGSWAPRPYSSWSLQRRLRGLPRVKDSFAVLQGVLTGLNRVFLIEKSEWLELPEPERAYFRSCVLNESVRGGRIYEEAYVFYPYGAAAVGDEQQLERAVPTFYKRQLLPNRPALLDRSGIGPEKWWTLTRHREQQVGLPKIVSTYFGDTGSFAWDEDGRFVVVQGYGWRAKRSWGRNVWLAYLALLNSKIFSNLLAAHSNHVGGGQWNLSKRFVEPMPLPRLDETADPQLLADLAALGEAIHDQGLSQLVGDRKRKLWELAEAAYQIAQPLQKRWPGKRARQNG